MKSVHFSFSYSVVFDSLRPHGLHTAHQASLSITNSWSLLKPLSIESVMPSSHLILCRPLLLPPSIFPSIRVFSNKLLSFKLNPDFLFNRTDELGQPIGFNSGLRSGMKIIDFFQSYFPFDVPLIQPTCRTFWRPLKFDG